MNRSISLLAALFVCVCANAQTNNYTVTTSVTDAQDSFLLNPWGLARPFGNAGAKNQWWWVSDQVSGWSTLYTGKGKTPALAITIPASGGVGPGSPTGLAANPVITEFAFATLDGTIARWSATDTPAVPGQDCLECHITNASTVVNNTNSGASYQGLTIATIAATGELAYYAANANGGVEVYDALSYARVTMPAGAFTDARIPRTYTPAGIQTVGSQIFVTYNASAGGGTGFVDAYDTNGKLIMRLQNGWFNQPWGVALAPANFGLFSNMILIGNTGSGWIGAYSRRTGKFQGFLQTGGATLTIPGLWGLGFGNGTPQSGPTDVLYFTAGGDTQTTGAFGAITAN